jgi:hypothetical protein
MAKKKVAKKQSARVGKRKEKPDIYPPEPQIIDDSKISFFLSREGLDKDHFEQPELTYNGTVLDLPTFKLRREGEDTIHFYTKRLTDLPPLDESVGIKAAGSLRITIKPRGLTITETHCFDVLLVPGPH